MPRVRRKKLLIDRGMQGTIVGRVLAYWLSCALFIAVPLLIAKTLAEPDRLFYEHIGSLWSLYWPVFTVSLFMVPLLLFDILRLTNRAAGPIFRLRRDLDEVIAGKSIDRIQFRPGDYWHDLAEQINEIVDVLKDKDRIEVECTLGKASTQDDMAPFTDDVQPSNINANLSRLTDPRL